MADKREVKKNIKRLQRVKTWQLLVLLVLMGFVSLTLQRLNNITMFQYREAVLSADKAGDATAVANALIGLQRFSSQHMNASTGPFYLEQSYKRDFQAAYERAASVGNPNGNINVKVDAVCAPQFSRYSQAYTDCTITEQNKYPPAPNPEERLKVPAADLYRHEFISPLFSFDFAGLSVALCGLLLLAIVARLVSLGVLYLLLRQRYASV